LSEELVLADESRKRRFVMGQESLPRFWKSS